MKPPPLADVLDGPLTRPERRAVSVSGDVTQARQGFRQLLTAPILFTPFIERGCRAIRFEGRIGLATILGLVTKVASTTGNAGLTVSPLEQLRWSLREAA